MSAQPGRRAPATPPAQAERSRFGGHHHHAFGTHLDCWTPCQGNFLVFPLGETQTEDHQAVVSRPESFYPELTKKVKTHYALRGFNPVAIDMLCAEINERSSAAGLKIAEERWESIGRLLDVFEPIEQAPLPAILHPDPAAIFALSFGYRLDSPFARFPEDRQPGKNNTAIAAQLERCQRIFPDAWVAAQYEVGLALEQATGLDRTDEDPVARPDLSSPPRDWTTPEVLSYFIDNLPSQIFTDNRSIVVVGHLHHFGRCAFMLSRAGLEPLVAPKEAVAYKEYDEREAQPRFRSAWEYLLNDFLSLCKTPRAASDLPDPPSIRRI